jgi:hypothetical protein
MGKFVGGRHDKHDMEGFNGRLSIRVGNVGTLGLDVAREIREILQTRRFLHISIVRWICMHSTMTTFFLPLYL